MPSTSFATQNAWNISVSSLFTQSGTFLRWVSLLGASVEGYDTIFRQNSRPDADSVLVVSVLAGFGAAAGVEAGDGAGATSEGLGAGDPWRRFLRRLRVVVPIIVAIVLSCDSVTQR